MLSMVETDEQRRTVEEFCSTQEYARIKDNVISATVNVRPEELPSEQVFVSSYFFPQLFY